MAEELGYDNRGTQEEILGRIRDSLKRESVFKKLFTKIWTKTGKSTLLVENRL